MKTRTTSRGIKMAAIASTLMLAAQSVALAQHGGGGHGGGGGRAGSGHAVSGGHVGARTGAYGAGRYGYRGGYAGRGGYRWGGTWIWGSGLFLAALPLYYSTFWWGGSPYYYANDNYYQWDSDVDQYQQVQPPTEVVQQEAMQPAGERELFAYPKNGQTTQQQATDKSACRSWATDQTNFDAAQPSSSGSEPSASGTLLGTEGATAQETAAPKLQEYLRAEAACLEARGYSVE